MTADPANLPDDVDALKHIIREMARTAVAAKAEIEKLRFELARLRRAQFGRFSEKLGSAIAQLELAIETLEEDQAERLAVSNPAVATLVEDAKPARRPLPEHLLREEITHAAPCACPACGGPLRKIGTDVTETLEHVPARFKVIRHLRDEFSCRTCDTVIQAELPTHAIARGRAGPALLSHIIVSKYDDHLPLHRQAEIYARSGVELDTSTLSGWVGAAAAALKPLIEALADDERPFSRARPQHSSTRPIARPTLPTFLSASPITQRNDLLNFCPGTGSRKTSTPQLERASSPSGYKEAGILRDAGGRRLPRGKDQPSNYFNWKRKYDGLRTEMRPLKALEDENVGLKKPCRGSGRPKAATASPEFRDQTNGIDPNRELSLK